MIIFVKIELESKEMYVPSAPKIHTRRPKDQRNLFLKNDRGIVLCLNFKANETWLFSCSKDKGVEIESFEIMLLFWQEGVLWTPSKMIARLGLEIKDESSIYYWAAKNKIPVFSPALTDGSLGDMLFFHSYRNPGLVLDIIQGEHNTSK